MSDEIFDSIIRLNNIFKKINNLGFVNGMKKAKEMPESHSKNYLEKKMIIFK